MMALTTTPPTGMGTYTNPADDRAVPYGSSRSYAAAVAHHGAQRSPCSNTGRLLGAPDAPAFVDYLAFTIRDAKRLLSRIKRNPDSPDGLGQLRSALWDIAADDWGPDRQRVGASALWADLGDVIDEDCTGHAAIDSLTGRRVEIALYLLARTVIEAVAPALIVDDLCGRGLNGYTDHGKIKTHLGENCGSIAVGGNRDTVHVILTGQACQRMDAAALADALDGFDVKIGRIDTAWDDLAGTLGTPRDAAANYVAGGFQPARGTRSENGQLIDDLQSGKGCTFYLGDRKSRLLRIYCKGQQLGDTASPWVRYEVQWMGTAFKLSTAHLRAPGALLASYPDLGHLPVISDGTAASRIQREAEISAAKTAEWVKSTCGASISLIADAVGADLFVELVRNDGVPRRLRSIADSRDAVSSRIGSALLEQRRHSPVALTPSFIRAWGKCNEQNDVESRSRIRFRRRAFGGQCQGQGLVDSFAGSVGVSREQVPREGHAHA